MLLQLASASPGLIMKPRCTLARLYPCPLAGSTNRTLVLAVLPAGFFWHFQCNYRYLPETKGKAPPGFMQTQHGMAGNKSGKNRRAAICRHNLEKHSEIILRAGTDCRQKPARAHAPRTGLSRQRGTGAAAHPGAGAGPGASRPPSPALPLSFLKGISMPCLAVPTPWARLLCPASGLPSPLRRCAPGALPALSQRSSDRPGQRGCPAPAFTAQPDALRSHDAGRTAVPGHGRALCYGLPPDLVKCQEAGPDPRKSTTGSEAYRDPHPMHHCSLPLHRVVPAQQCCAGRNEPLSAVKPKKTCRALADKRGRGSGSVSRYPARRRAQTLPPAPAAAPLRG